jgi:hypothetical protein
LKHCSYYSDIRGVTANGPHYGLWPGRIMDCGHYLRLKEFLNQLNLHMFIFIINQELCICELMNRIMSCNDFMGRKDISKFVYYFISCNIYF